MKIYKLLGIVLIALKTGAVPCYAQQDIIGTVYNHSTGEPISDVSIIDEKTKILYKTDALGSFRLEPKTLPTLISISHVGFEPLELTVRDQDSIRLFLIPLSTELEEVVINTGYQSIPKDRATGSFETINESSLNHIVSSNILERLEGTSTLLFDKHNNRPAITMRGFSTIRGDKDPLVVLDNFPFEGDINAINPADIESITLLKDAAAQSIWGTRAGNGVIVITTKKGKFNSSSKIDFSSSVQTVAKPDLNYHNLISTSDLIDLEKYLFEQGYYKNSQDLISKGYISPVVALMIANDKNGLSDGDLSAELDKLRFIDNREQYSEGVYRNSLNQRYSLNFTSGWDRLSIFLGGSYDKNRDVLDNYGDRIGLRNNLNYKLSSSIDLNLNFTYSQRENVSGKTGFDPKNGLRPYVLLYDDDKATLPMPGLNSIYLETIEGFGLLDWNQYPYKEHTYNEYTSAFQNFYASFNLKYRLNDWVSFDLMYTLDKQNNDIEEFRGRDSYYTRNLINQFSEIDPVTKKIKQNIPYGDILNNTQSDVDANNYRAQVNINKNWNLHKINAIIGAEMRAIEKRGNSFQTYGFDGEVYTTSRVNYDIPYKDFVNGRSQYIPYYDSYNGTNNNFVSQYFNGAYTYNSKYVLSASIRRDASNLFGLSTNDKWQPLWSLGTSWKVSEEGFYNKNNLPELKVKITYGKSGLVNQSATAVSVLTYRTAGITNYLSGLVNKFPNPELRWEKSSMLNIGLDFGSSAGRMQGSVAYYRKRGTDLFGPSPVDITAGVGTTINRNIADMQGYGWDANLGIRWTERAVVWGSSILFSYTKSKVTDYYNTTDESNVYVSDGTGIAPQVGKPLYSVVSYPFLGLDDQGRPVSSLEGEKSIDYQALINAHYDNLVYSGSAIPVIYGSLMNSVSYKRFNLNINILYKMGHYFKGPAITYSSLIEMRAGNGSGSYSRRWQKPGDENTTDVPAFIYPLDSRSQTVYLGSDAEVHKGDHVRLNFIRLNYEFGRIQMINQQVKMRVFLNAENLGILWKASNINIDPDFVEGMPGTKRFSVGLTINL